MNFRIRGCCQKYTAFDKKKQMGFSKIGETEPSLSVSTPNFTLRKNKR